MAASAPDVVALSQAWLTRRLEGLQLEDFEEGTHCFRDLGPGTLSHIARDTGLNLTIGPCKEENWVRHGALLRGLSAGRGSAITGEVELYTRRP